MNIVVSARGHNNCIGAVPESSSANNLSILYKSLSSIDLRGLLMMLIGSMLSGFANQTMDTLVIAILFFLAGSAITMTVFRSRQAEKRAFLLTYGICVFAGGMAQCYSDAAFGITQSTTDANTFIGMISPQPPWTSMADAYMLNESTLPVVIWQQIYKVAYWLGLDFGPYTGVIFNAFVMGLSASLTVRLAREIYGEDRWRLQRVGSLFACCGIFVLFGSVLLRDCFTTFVNILMISALARFIFRQTIMDFVLAAAMTCASAFILAYLRPEAVVIIGLYFFMAMLFWIFTNKLTMSRIFMMFLFLGGLLLFIPYIQNYTDTSLNAQSTALVEYNNLSEDTSSYDSLGMRLVVNQPLPIRLIAGSVMMLISPMPVWANFTTRSADYHWFMGFYGIYKILVLPLFIMGVFIVIAQFKENSRLARTLFFRNRSRGLPVSSMTF